MEHIIRGDVGWPLSTKVSAFTFSLLIYALVFPGLYLTASGRLLTGFWVFVAMLGFALVSVTHLGPFAADPLPGIYSAYANPVSGVLALLSVIGLLVSLVVLALVALRARRRSR